MMDLKLNLDCSEAEAKLEAMSKKVMEMRAQLRPWWCPRWLFNLVNG